MGGVWLVGVSGAVIYHLCINVHLPCKGEAPMVPYEKCTGLISLCNLIWKICFLVAKVTRFSPIQGRIQEFGKGGGGPGNCYVLKRCVFTRTHGTFFSLFNMKFGGPPIRVGTPPGSAVMAIFTLWVECMIGSF